MVTPKNRVVVPEALLGAWAQQLHRFHHSYNYDYLGSRLRTPVFRLVDSTDRLGAWRPETRTIEISTEHILTHTWEDVLETLRHEMAHQYVSEVHGAPARAHGPEWAEACRLLRVAPEVRAKAGDLAPLEGSTEERDRMLLRVKELLALAGSPNEHEAASAMRMAQKYLLKYNLDLREVGREPSYETRYVMRCRARVQEWESTLAVILQEHFFVLAIFTTSYDPFLDRGGSSLQILGTRENLDIAEYVFGYVTSLVEPLYKEHRLRYGEASGTRLQYWAGLMRGFHEKLEGQKKQLSSELGLVWKGDPRLGEYFRELHPHVRSRSSSGVDRGDAYQAGRFDGQSINVHKGLGSSRGTRGRALPGPGS